MASELEEALALLDAAPILSNSLRQFQSQSTDNVREPGLHWGIMDDDIGDFQECVNNNNNNTQTTKKKTKINSTKKKKKSCNPNKARDERRFQIIALNEEVTELQFTLKQLQTIRDNRSKVGNSPPTENNSETLPPVWQEICIRQLGRRLEAERGNLRLKQQYEKEKQLLKSFEKLLYNRRTPREATSEARKHTRRTDIPDGYIERMAALIFQELAAGVKICYSKVDSFFETNRLVPMNIVTHSALLEGGGKERGTERKFYDRRTMPFDIYATGDAWWENWHNYRGQGGFDAALDEIVERFGLEMSDFKTNTSATAYAQQITQRHVEEGRIVFVFDAYVEPFGFENERVGGVYFLEQTYVLVQPEEGGDGEISTRVSTCYVITPHFLDPKLKEDGKTTAMVNFLVSALSSKIMTLSEMVENMLLDQALQAVQSCAATV